VLRLLRRRDRDDRGLSLAETMVSLGLTVAVVLLATTALIDTSRAVRRNDTRVDSTTIARKGIADLTRVLRTATQVETGSTPALAPAFVYAGPEDLTVYANITADQRPTRVRFRVTAARDLVEDKWAATSSTAPYTFAATPVTRVIGRKVPTGSTSLFTYLDATGAAMTPPLSDELARGRVKTVLLTMTVQANPNSAVPPAVVTNQVHIPNI